MNVAKLGVVGAGQMGQGIAQVAAQAGCEVVVYEADAAALERGFARIAGSLAKLVEKQKLAAAQKDAALARLRPATELGALADCDLVIEAIVENLDAKRELFRALDPVVQSKAIFASNTSPASPVASSASSACTSSIRCSS